MGIINAIFGKKDTEENMDKPVIDYTSLRKPQLIAECKKRDLDAEGKRDDLIARLVVDDEAKMEAEKAAKIAEKVAEEPVVQTVEEAVDVSEADKIRAKVQAFADRCDGFYSKEQMQGFAQGL